MKRIFKDTFTYNIRFNTYLFLLFYQKIKFMDDYLSMDFGDLEDFGQWFKYLPYEYKTYHTTMVNTSKELTKEFVDKYTNYNMLLLTKQIA